MGEQTERDAERELRDSEERFRVLSDGSRDAVFIQDNGVVQVVNRAFSSLFGYGPDEAIGKNGLDLILSPESHEVVKASMAETGEVEIGEIVCITKDGRRIRVDSHAAPVTYRGRPMRVVTCQDLTQRLAAQAAVRQSEERLRLALDAADLGTWDWDVVIGTAVWSPRVFAILGIEDPSSNGDLEALLRALHPDDGQALINHIRDTVMASNSAFREEFRIVQAKGAIRWVEARGQVFFNEGGDPIRMAGTLMDVTHRRELEERLERGQRMEALGRLAGGVAHDFNNLLTVVLSSAQMAGGLVGPEHGARKWLSHIQTASEKAAALTKQLLIFARRSVTEPRAVQLDVVIRDVSKMLSSVIGASIHLELSLSSSPWSVYIDPTQAEMLVMNLALNAKDAMPDGGTLRMQTCNLHAPRELYSPDLPTPPGDWIMLVVSDTGVGMDEEVRRHLFEPFFTTKSPGKGTGLGLAICHAAVVKAGGRIDVESSKGDGTTFRVLLPRHEARIVESLETPLPTRSYIGKETILVIEDESAVRDLACTILSSCGYRVLSASGAVEAFDVVSKHQGPIHLFLSDVVMPQMNGPELILRLSRRYPEARVLYMSGYPGDDHLGLGGSPKKMLAKPFSPQQLMERVRLTLDA